MHFRESFSRRFFMVFNVVFLAALALACLLPMINVLAVSFSSAAAAQAGYVTFWPINFTLKSYEYALGRPQFLTAMWVSVERILLGGAINMVLTILAAYPLSKDNSKFRLRTAYSWFFVVTMLVSGGLIPTFMVISKLGMMDSLWALIIPGGLTASSVFLFRQFYTSLPKELEEAARLDGLGELRIYLQIYTPLMKPAFATVGLLTFQESWNNFLWPLLVTTDDNLRVIQVGLAVFRQLETTSWNFLMAGTTLATVPMVILFLFAQRYFVQGFANAGIK